MTIAEVGPRSTQRGKEIMQPVSPNKQYHKPVALSCLTCLNHVLIHYSQAQRAVMTPDTASRDELVVLALMADWSPACIKLDAELQKVNCELNEEGDANGTSHAAHTKVRVVQQIEVLRGVNWYFMIV